MKILVASGRLGPMAVFLPDGTQAMLPRSVMTDAMQAQAGALGTQSSWLEHAQRLVAGSPYAGHWSFAEVPDGSDAHQALYRIRHDTAGNILAQLSAIG